MRGRRSRAVRDSRRVLTRHSCSSGGRGARGGGRNEGKVTRRQRYAPDSFRNSRISLNGGKTRLSIYIHTGSIVHTEVFGRVLSRTHATGRYG